MVSASDTTSPASTSSAALPSYAERTRIGASGSSSRATASSEAASSAPTSPVPTGRQSLPNGPASVSQPLTWGSLRATASGSTAVPSAAAEGSVRAASVTSGDGEVGGQSANTTAPTSMSSSASATGSATTPVDPITPVTPLPSSPPTAKPPVPNVWAARREQQAQQQQQVASAVSPPSAQKAPEPTAASMPPPSRNRSQSIQRRTPPSADVVPPNLDDPSSWPSAEAASASTPIAKAPGSPTLSVTSSVNGSRSGEKKKQKWEKLDVEIQVAGSHAPRHGPRHQNQSSNANSNPHSRQSSAAGYAGAPRGGQFDDRRSQRQPAHLPGASYNGIPPPASFGPGPGLPSKPAGLPPYAATSSHFSRPPPVGPSMSSSSRSSAVPSITTGPSAQSPSEPRSRQSTVSASAAQSMEPSSSGEVLRTAGSDRASSRASSSAPNSNAPYPPALGLTINGHLSTLDNGPIPYGAGGYRDSRRPDGQRGNARGGYRGRGGRGRGGNNSYDRHGQPPMSPTLPSPINMPLIDGPYDQQHAFFYPPPYGMPAPFYPPTFVPSQFPQPGAQMPMNPAILGAPGAPNAMPMPQFATPQSPPQPQPLQPATESFQRPPPMQVYEPPLDPTRHWVLGQIEYYLSPENLSRDTFLRQQMDADGYIELNLIASFNRVRALTIDLGLIRDALTLSPVLEVQGMKVRRKSDWERWLLPNDTALPRTMSASPPPSSVADVSALAPPTAVADDQESTTTAVATATYTNPSEIGASTGPPPAVTSEIPLAETIGNKQPTLLIGDSAPPPRRLKMSVAPRRGVPVVDSLSGPVSGFNLAP